jgi:hypothetical protein
MISVDGGAEETSDSRCYNRDFNPGLLLYETEILSVFEVLTALLLNIQVFCDVTLCEQFSTFRKTVRLLETSAVTHTATHSRRLESSEVL